MTESAGAMDEKASNSCCAALNKKHTKLLEKYKKVEEIKNKLRDCLDMVSQKYDSIEKENRTLGKELEQLKVQADIWGDEKEKATDIRINLDTQVSDLKHEIEILKEKCQSGSQEASPLLQERLIMAEKEIKDLKVLLNEERARASLEKQNTELEKKKAYDAIKRAEIEMKRASEAQNLANVQRKVVGERDLMLEKLKIENDSLKSMLALEKKKSDKALKKAELGNKNVTESQLLTDLQKKKTNENRLLLEKLRSEIVSVKSILALEKSKSEAADKNAEKEKQNAIREKERADLAEANANELKKIAEVNLKEAVTEKDRADNLNKMLEKDASKRLTEKSGKCICFDRSFNAQADGSSGVGVAICANNSLGGLSNSTSGSQLMEKSLRVKEKNVILEKKHADSEKKTTKKLKKVAEERMRTEQEKRVDQLTEKVEFYKLRLEELSKKLQENFSFNPPMRCSFISETDTVKLLKKQLKLEKMLTKQAKKASKMGALQNKMLLKEVCHLKQECLFLQQRMHLLEKSIFCGGECVPLSKKPRTDGFSRETLHSIGYRSHVFSGTDSRLEHPCTGCNKKILQTSEINSSSAFFSEPTLMGPQERGTLFVSTSPDAVSNIPERKRLKYSENVVDCSRKSSPKFSARMSSPDRNNILDAVDSIKVLYSEGEMLHKHASEKLDLFYRMFEHEQEGQNGVVSEKTSRRKVSRPSKGRKISSDGQLVLHNLEASEGMNRQSTMDSHLLMPSEPPGPPSARSEHCVQDWNSIPFDTHPFTAENFDKISTNDYMMLLDLDDEAEENLFRRAMARPLSPSLPVVEYERVNKLEADNDEIRVNRSSLENCLIVRDDPETPSSCQIDDSIPLKLHVRGSDANYVKNVNSIVKTDGHAQIFHASRNLCESDASDSVKQKICNLLESGNDLASNGLLKYLTVFSSNKNQPSILRILQAIVSCKQQCSFLRSAETFVKRTLEAILKAENLSMKEKVCVLLSQLVNAIIEAAKGNLLNGDLIQSINSASVRILSALSDPVLRRMFMESIDFYEFHSVIEDFILRRKLLVYFDSPPQHEALFIPENLREVTAPSYLLVACGNLLATVCLAVDQIGLVCETSCNIFAGFTSDPAVLLAILHVFARVCGRRFLTLPQHSMKMAVVKSLISVLEKQPLSTNSVASSCPLLMLENSSENWSCKESCPFSEGAISMEDLALMLLSNFQKHLTSRADNALKLEDLANPNYKNDEDFLEFADILSLIETVASFMEWRWTFDHFVIKITEYLESHSSSDLSAIATLLLGQLGRLGVDACGYEDNGVRELQRRLSAFVCDASFKKMDLLHQFAIVSSLLGLTPLKLDEVVEDRVEASASAPVSYYTSCRLIREWFLQLSSKQHALFKLHQASQQQPRRL